MELSRRCKDHWGIGRNLTPFGTHIEEAGGLYIWPEFDELVERIEQAVARRKYLIVAGAACSAKTVAWTEAKRRLAAKALHHFCEPCTLDKSQYRDQTIYHAIKHTIEPPDGSRDRMLRRFREDRATQCRQLLERCNVQQQPVVLAINDAHECQREFVILCKKLWDDLEGYDRLLAIILIGQPGLAACVADCREVAARSEIVWTPGLGSIDNIRGYLDHECARVGITHSPFADDAVAELGKLRRDRARDTLDHPLIVNNIVSRALHDAWRIKASAVDADLMAAAMRAEAVA